MLKTWPVDPLERTCMELPPASDNQEERASTVPAKMSVRQLADVPVFVLLGEPGMGKSETLKALAALTQDNPITVNDFIVTGLAPSSGGNPIFIDALDEARASGDTTVWRELRKGIAQAGLHRFGIACRAADWETTDKGDLAAVAQGQRIRVFTLDPLTPEQRRALLKNEGIANVEFFEKQAEGLGLADMLGNPQSLKLLAAAAKNQPGGLPKTRREAYELACRELVKEPNARHQQAQRRHATLPSHDELLSAAGWLCALMLLSNCAEVSEEEPVTTITGQVWLADVLGKPPANGFSVDAARRVLRRPLFRKPSSGYTPVHRTVAEYLAARYIAQCITAGLLPTRVAALTLASPQHLVGNLRGLAGWLAALSEPMRAAIFQADPAAVLNYGDLHLLSTQAKQALIEHLAKHPRTQVEGNHWKRAASHAPLVEPDMRGFVVDWLERYSKSALPTGPETTVAYVLLFALQDVQSDPTWEPMLLDLVRDERLPEEIRGSALEALAIHKSSPTILRTLLDDLRRGTLRDPKGRLNDRLLRQLYPEHLPPSELLQYLKPTHVRHRGLPGFGMFWQYDIKKQTPDELLPQLMDALEQATNNGTFANDAFRASSYGFEGLQSLAIKAIEIRGTNISVSQLSRWLRLFSYSESMPFHSLRQDDQQRLNEWLQAHSELLKQVLTHWVEEGVNSWDAQHRFAGMGLPPAMGRFWLDQTLHFQALGETAKAKDCLETAVWWLDQPNSGITLDDLATAIEKHSVLQASLEQLLVERLDDNPRRKHWLQDQKYRHQASARNEVNERNRSYLLEHLDEVRNGRQLDYLSSAAWADMKDSGYDGGPDSELYEQWREAHLELDIATHQGYLTLLQQLTLEQATKAVDSRKNNRIWHFELPCLVAARRMHAQDPEALLQLGQERLQALTTLFLLNSVSDNDWLLTLVDKHPDWVEEVWWQLSAQALRSKKQIRLPHLWLLAREPRVRLIALHLLPRMLSKWPAKFPEQDFTEFAQLLEAVLKVCPPAEISTLVQQRLRKRSLGSLQTAYLVMAGLWVDPSTFAPLVETLLNKKQIFQAELLGFINHLRRYGDSGKNLPCWDATTMAMLFRLLAPLCPSSRPSGAGWITAKDDGREFLYQLLGALRNDTSDAAQQALQGLLEDAAMGDWHPTLEEAFARQAQARAERAFALPNAKQVALTLQNSTPANPTDLMAVAFDALNSLQQTLRNSPTNLINSFWSVDANGKRPQPPHRPEEACRDVIAEWLKPRMNAIGISVEVEHQHGGQKRADIALRVQTTAHPNMLLPVEVKGDWHRDLWKAPREQLAKQYASDPNCHGRGIYLVLWLGAQRGDESAPKHPNQAIRTAEDLQTLLQQTTDETTPGMYIRVVVLDVSIPR